MKYISQTIDFILYKDGDGISEEITQYYQSASYSSAPDPASGWSDSFPTTWDKDKPYIWKRTKQTWTKKENGEFVTKYINVQLMSEIEVATIMAQKSNTDLGTWCQDNKVSIIGKGMIATGAITANEIDTNGLQAEYIQSSNYSIAISDSLVFTERQDGTYKVGLKQGYVSETVIIPEIYNGKPVIEIDKGSFAYGKDIIKTLAIPASVTVMPFGFLDGYTNLEELHIPVHNERLDGHMILFCNWFGMGAYDDLLTVPSSLSRVYLLGRDGNNTVPDSYFDMENKFPGEFYVYLTPTIINLKEDSFLYFDCWTTVYHYGQLTYFNSDWTVAFEALDEPYVFPCSDVASGFRITSRYGEPMINSSHFKVSQDGEIEAASGDIAGWRITESALYKNTNGISSGMCSVAGIVKQENATSTVNVEQENTASAETIQQENVAITPSEGLTYQVNDDGETCTVTGIGDCKDSEIFIGGSFHDYRITAIGDRAFMNISKITSVTIGDSVINIGEYAFTLCYNLTSVTIGGSVDNIGDYAFYDCSALTSLTILNGAVTIGSNAFNNCKKITTVTIPTTVISDIPKSNLTTVVLIGGEHIDSGAFDGCGNLTSITIPDSVTNIGSSAFYGCNSLTSIVVDGNNLTYQSINGNLYSKNGTVLIAYAIGKTDTSFTIPYSVTSIGSYAFNDCSSLTSITIPDSVTSIGSFAFYNCGSLTSITIPDSVTSVGSYVFVGCNDALNILCICKKIDTVGWDSLWNVMTDGGSTKFVTRYGYVPNGIESVAEDGYSYPRFFAGSRTNIPASANDAKFLVLEDGSLYSKAINISGTGKIGGYTLSNDVLTSGSGDKTVMLDGSDSGTYAFTAGSDVARLAPFSVTKDGVVSAVGGSFTGNIIAADCKVGPISFNNYGFNISKVTIRLYDFKENGFKRTLNVYDENRTSNLSGHMNYNYYNLTDWKQPYVAFTTGGSYPTGPVGEGVQMRTLAKIAYTKPHIAWTFDEIKAKGTNVANLLASGDWEKVNISDNPKIYLNPGSAIMYLNANEEMICMHHFPLMKDCFGTASENLITATSTFASISSGVSSMNTYDPGFYIGTDGLLISGGRINDNQYFLGQVLIYADDGIGTIRCDRLLVRDPNGSGYIDVFDKIKNL